MWEIETGTFHVLVSSEAHAHSPQMIADCGDADLREASWVISEPGHILTLTMHVETHTRMHTLQPRWLLQGPRPSLACLPGF